MYGYTMPRKRSPYPVLSDVQPVALAVSLLRHRLLFDVRPTTSKSGTTTTVHECADQDGERCTTKYGPV